MTQHTDPLASFRGPDGELDPGANIERELDLEAAAAEAPRPRRIDRVIDARTERPNYYRVVLAIRRADVALTVAVDVYGYDGEQARAFARDAAAADTGVERDKWTVERTEVRG